MNRGAYLTLSLSATRLQYPTFLCRLKENVVTPTTKAADHDVPISPEEIVAQGLVSQEDWDSVRRDAFALAIALFEPASPCGVTVELRAGHVAPTCLHVLVNDFA